MSQRKYPTRVKQDPQFAMELLAQIRRQCLTGTPLNGEQQAYLAEAILQMQEGIEPKRALHLTKKMGRQVTTFDERSRKIYNQVEALTAKGMSLRSACGVVAAKTPKNAEEVVTGKAIEAIHRKIAKAVEVPKHLKRPE